MGKGFVVLGLLLSLSALASEDFDSDDNSEKGLACVQNLAKSSQGLTGCEKFPQLFSFLTPVREEDGPVCTRIYLDYFCKTSPVEYKHAVDRAGNEVCIIDSDQPVLNMCKTLPKTYTYIKLKP